MTNQQKTIAKFKKIAGTLLALQRKERREVKSIGLIQ
tara:strand:- start:362 stop:472 length:111 start_codon:yes stop_codon:yes gene_type:complete